MKGLFLPGSGCTSAIWDRMRPYFRGHEVDYIDYPHEVTAKAKSYTDLTDWLRGKIGSMPYDFVVGHSMGGAIALDLVKRYRYHFPKVILVEANLRPANAFYRNLLTEENRLKFGKYLTKMIVAESRFYSEELRTYFKADFDFTPLVTELDGKLPIIYGDRGEPEYSGKYADLNLEAGTLAKLDIAFVADCAHMPMLENPREFSIMILERLTKLR